MDEYLFDIILIGIIVIFCLYVSLNNDSDKFKVIPPYMPKICNKRDSNIKNMIDEIDEVVFAKKAIFVDASYHGDYFDIMRILNNLSDNNIVFNNENANVVSVSPGTNYYYVDTLAKQINMINKQDCNAGRCTDLQNEQDEAIKSWGYKKQFAKRNFKWEQQLEDLGLPRDLYKDYAEPAPINIYVRHAEQNETESQIQYIVDVAIHKLTSNVNLIAKLTFVQQKGEPNIEFESSYVHGYEK